MIYFISELVKSDGTKIGGDEKIDQSDSYTTSPSKPATTTDDFVRMSRQGMNRHLYRQFWGEEDSTNKDVEEPKDGLDESAKEMMKGVLEDILSGKSIEKDLVDKFKSKEVFKNKIPNIEYLKDSNPILIRKVSALKDIIEKNNATGEEKAIILNHLFDMGLTDIPSEYKQLLRKKIR